MSIKSGRPVAAIEIGGTYIRTGVYIEDTMVAKEVKAWPECSSAEEDLAFLISSTQSLINQAEVGSDLASIGVSLAALVDNRGSVIDWPNRPSWRGLAFRSHLETQFAIPVCIEDDANAAAFAEWKIGSGQGHTHLLYVAAGTGIGAGLIIDSQLYRGQNGWAGELGHIVVQPDGVDCTCGHRGCLQTLASGRALERKARERGLPTAGALTDAAWKGEPWACDEINACGRWLGLGIANLINLLDVETVIVGGGLITLGQLWWSALNDSVLSNLNRRFLRQVTIKAAAMPSTSGLLGAALLARRLDEELNFNNGMLP